MPKNTRAAHGLVLAGCLVYVVNSALDWQQLRFASMDGQTYVGFGRSEWHGAGLLAGLLGCALLGCEAATMLSARSRSGAGSQASEEVALAALAATLGLFTAVAFAASSLDRAWPAWLGLVVGVALVAASVLRAAGLAAGMGTSRRDEHGSTRVRAT